MGSKLNIVNRFFIYMSQEKFLKAASLVRIGFGLLILYNYSIVYFQRDVLYSPIGILGTNPIDYTLYGLSSSKLYFEILYHMGIIFAILFTLGYKGRTVSLLNFILTFSFIRQGFLMTDGGDNLMYLLLFYLLFANTTAYYSIDSSKYDEINKNDNTIIHVISTIIHNFAILACIIQICILYFISGLYQIKGDMWANGTALYYIMQNEVFSNPHITRMIINYDFIIVSATYASILVKIAFPFLILNRRTKYIAVISIVLFHLSIGVFMGLITFSLTMIIAELFLFTDDEFGKIKNSIRKIKMNFLMTIDIFQVRKEKEGD